MSAPPAAAAPRRASGSNPGWRERLSGRTGAAVGAGAAAGTCYALVRNEPALAAATTTSASFGIVALTFCSLQELCRLLRQADGPENSLLAGAGSGALLRGLHHGRAYALPGALAAGALAYGTHCALDAHAAGSLTSALGLQHLRDERLWSWVPVRRISDEEIAARERAFMLRVAQAGAAPNDGPFVRLGGKPRAHAEPAAPSSKREPPPSR